jgi:hypothetical protein
MRDFVHRILHDLEPRVSGEDGLKALAIAVAAGAINALRPAQERKVYERTAVFTSLQKSVAQNDANHFAPAYGMILPQCQEFQYSIEHGAVGATCNPVIVLGVLKKELKAWKEPNPQR